MDLTPLAGHSSQKGPDLLAGCELPALILQEELL